MKNNFIEVNTDYFYSVVPLHFLLRFFNLSVVNRNGKCISTRCSLIVNIMYILIFGIISVVFLVFKIQRFEHIKKETAVKFSGSFHLTYLIGFSEYLIDMYFVTKYGKDCLIKYFERFRDIDSILSMKYCNKIRSDITRTLFLFMTFFFTSTSFDYCVYVLGYGWFTPTLYTVDYIYFFLNTLTILDAISQFVQLEYRLKMIKDILQDYYEGPNQCIDKFPPITDGKPGTRLEYLSTVMYNKNFGIAMLNKCYLMLLEQTKFINTSFGLRILIFYANLIMNIVTMSNIAIRVAVGCMVLIYGNRLLPTMASITRTMNFAALAILPVYRCEQTYRQSDKIIAIIDLILANKNNSEDMTNMFKELRHLIITRPIKFHAANFFTLDYTLLVSLTSVIVTYSIIMLQNVK